MSDELKMIDISEKKDVIRIAIAEGIIHLKKSTIKKILEGTIKKGNVIVASKLAGILGVKKTPELLPLCHPIPLTNIDVTIEKVDDNRIKVKVLTKTIGKTGSEMDALTGVAIALLNIWDMIKSYEKDENGQYPETWIEQIRVVEKKKKIK
ncbi:MAG: cyclic pyranopterin monophosphate synthase MoaC [Candidatus Njordarchaeia archaeon]|nr:cyclic pyranopterin monophosphate synthase MoaC [Candidatus Korarchaeota archaeon]